MEPLRDGSLPLASYDFGDLVVVLTNAKFFLAFIFSIYCPAALASFCAMIQAVTRASSTSSGSAPPFKISS